jgi:hypothetical protein
MFDDFKPVQYVSALIPVEYVLLNWRSRVVNWNNATLQTGLF